MDPFYYKAADASGNVVSGTIEAADESRVVASLHDQGYIPIRISAAESEKFAFNRRSAKSLLFRTRRVSLRDLAQFTHDLTILLGTGMPMDRSLKVLIDTTEGSTLNTVIKKILADVATGSYLSEALARHPKVFNRFYVNMVKAGETAGLLEPTLRRMGEFLEQTQNLKEYVCSAMVYPLFLVAVGGISILIMLTFVVPKFALIFEDLGQSLPLTTRVILDFSQLLKNYFWILILSVAAGVYVLQRYDRTAAGRYHIDHLKLKMPVIRHLVQSYETARFARTLGTLMQNGVPILQALALVKDIIGNRRIADSLELVLERVKEGESLSAPLADSGMFQTLAVEMITVGEESGRLEQMLLRVGEVHDKKVRHLVRKLVSLIEPAMILAMGVLVGVIVISMLLAIFSMNDIPF